jgi:azurin
LRGHDVLEIKSVSVLADGRSLFLEIPDLQPVNQLHLLVKSSAQAEHDLFLTVHHLDAPLQVRPGTPARNKVILPHPLLADLKRPMVTRRNPHTKAIENAHSISIAAATNLMFDTTELHVRAGQPLRLTFSNPDVVPHNWALLQPGALQEVGEQANKLISDPDAAANHYIPESDKVLVYTDVVEPYASFTIYFQAPAQPGRYPYLCTFPGHWMVMNGTMVVQ